MLINKITEHLSQSIEAGELTNGDLVQLIEHVGSYLNLATIPEYAKANNLSYNGVKKFRTVLKIFNIKFVIEND